MADVRLTRANAEVVVQTPNPRVGLTRANAEVVVTHTAPRIGLTRASVEVIIRQIPPPTPDEGGWGFIPIGG